MDIKYNSSITVNPNLPLKSFIYFSLIIIVAFCLQIVFLSSLPFFPGTANLLLVVSIILSIILGEYRGFFIGLICGALLDIWLNTWFINSCLFSLLSVGFGYIGNHLAKKNLITVILSIILGTFLFEGITAVAFFFGGFQYAGWNFLTIIIPHIIYNVILGFIIYFVFNFILS